MEPATRFDDQAPTFDRRAGVPPEVAAAVATSVLEAGGSAEVVVELGAGTGQVGLHLAERAARYVGIDLSGPMLDVFRPKLAGRPAAVLLQADAARHWPVRDSSVTVVFASRVAHLLDRAHVVAEARRVCRPGGRVVIGKIERAGVKQVLRRQRESMLADRGVPQIRSGGRRTQALLEALADAGGISEDRRTVATWEVFTTAHDVLAAWEGMSAMGGETVDPAVKADVLENLRQWAAAHVGDLDAPQTSTESFVLEGVRLG